MPDAILAAEPQPPPLTSTDFGFDDFAAAFNNVPIPSMDSLFDDTALTTEAFASDLDFSMDFEITFDDIDNLCIPSDAEDFLLPDAYNPIGDSISPINDDHGDLVDHIANNCNYDVVNPDLQECGNSEVSGDRGSGLSRFFNSQVSDTVSFEKELSPADNLGNQDSLNSVDVKVSTFPSPEYEFCDREEYSNGLVSSQGSGNVGSGVYEAMNSSSPDSNSYRDISSYANENADKGIIKTDEIGKGDGLKRKKEQSEGSAETRTTKFRGDHHHLCLWRTRPNNVNLMFM